MNNKHQIVVAYDFSKHADVALQKAVDLACSDPENVLHFITVIDAGQDYQTCEDVQKDLLARLKLVFEARRPDLEIDFYVHARIGKVSFNEAALADNAKALIQALVRAKPSTAKGTYVRSITISSTMGPGVKIDPGQFIAKTEEG